MGIVLDFCNWQQENQKANNPMAVIVAMNPVDHPHGEKGKIW